METEVSGSIKKFETSDEKWNFFELPITSAKFHCIFSIVMEIVQMQVPHSYETGR